MTSHIETQKAFAVALQTAAARIAPLWPLGSFVAVNPYFGHADMPADVALRHLAATGGAQYAQLMDIYRTAYKEGDIQISDLKAAKGQLGLDMGIDSLLAALDQQNGHTSCEPKLLPTVASIIGTGQASRVTDMIIGRISQWAAAYFDGGQATARAVQPDHDALASWLLWAQADYTLDMLGHGGVRTFMRSLSGDRDQLLGQLLQQLQIDADAAPVYLERLLRQVAGWAGYVRQLQWQDELAGNAHLSLVKDLGVMCLAYEAALLAAAPADYQNQWGVARAAYAQGTAGFDGQEATMMVWQEAYEHALRRQLRERFAEAQPIDAAGRYDVQAAFCIDVRSERIRRAMEATVPHAQTLGFAGFFGFAFELRPAGADHGRAQCPVLLNPSHLVGENISSSTERLKRRSRLARAIKRFKNSAVGSFAFVDAAGLYYGAKLITDSLGLTSPVRNIQKLTGAARVAVQPEITPLRATDGLAGYSLSEQVDVAESALRGMSLTDGFADIVLMVGHESHSRNNPHAAGLDCGACGGNSGEMNARVAALVLNKPEVRAGLASRGIIIPSHVWFFGAVHNTTTDAITIFRADTETVAQNAALSARLDRLDAQLASASSLAQAERAPDLQLADLPSLDTPAAQPIAQQMAQRARDWAQVRPEWGLAGCTSFIAAPRHRTSAHHLDGKTFLHTYEAAQDPEHKVLEVIMTAPMVVASWINLQYYASTLDNKVFGAGDKTLHNVVGGIGVLEGNGGDLRGGLPMQSVHDGSKAMHQPSRLHVVLEAPKDAIHNILQKHSHIKDLVENKWIYISAMDKSGRISHSYDGDGTWTNLLDDSRLGEKEIAA